SCWLTAATRRPVRLGPTARPAAFSPAGTDGLRISSLEGTFVDAPVEKSPPRVPLLDDLPPPNTRRAPSTFRVLPERCGNRPGNRISQGQCRFLPLLKRRADRTSHALIGLNSARKFIAARPSCVPKSPASRARV